MPHSLKILALAGILILSSLNIVGMATRPPDTSSDIAPESGTGAQLPDVSPPGVDAPLKGVAGAQWKEPSGAGDSRMYYPLGDTGMPGVGSSSGAAQGRGPGRAGPDVAPVYITFVGPNNAISTYGAAAVGRPTQFNVTVENLGDADAGQVDISIRLTDFFNNLIGLCATSLVSLAAGANETVIWPAWTPSYSTTFTLNATVTASGDTNTSNNTLLWTDLSVCRWIDNCDSQSGWSGSLAPAMWHITGTVYDDPAPYLHTGPSAWYCGNDGSMPAHYDNNMDATLITPSLDLTWMNPKYYVLLNFNYYGNTTYSSDRLDIYVSEDDGSSWYSIFATLTGGMNSHGWFSWVSHWTDYDGDGYVDANEPHQDGLDLQKFAGHTVKLKFRFVSDETVTNLGFYLDDFVLRGWENLNDVSLQDITTPDVEALGVEQTYSTTIKNMGQTQQQPFPVYFNVSDGTAFMQSAPALPSGQSAVLTWKWMPQSPGNYTIRCTIAPFADEVWGDNFLWRPAHVAAGPASILVVDDDSGPGNNGMLYGYNAADVEWGVTSALAFTDYDVYLVANDGDGPPLEILNRYGLVIWVTGYDNSFVSRTGTLSGKDVLNLTAYLENHGRLWLSSFEVMWDTWVVQRNASFALNYLHVSTWNPDIDDDAGIPNPMDGVPDDEITDGMAFNISAPPSGLYDKCDRIANDSASAGIFFQYNQNKDKLTGPFNAIRHSSAFKTVFMAFEFTFIANGPDRAYLASKVVDWMWRGVQFSAAEVLEKSVLPGSSVTYNLTLVNSEPRNWPLDGIWAGTLPAGWGASVEPSVVNGSPALSVPPTGVLAVLLTVTAPFGEPAGKSVPVQVFARLAGSPYHLSISANSTVLGVAGIELQCTERDKSAFAGDEVTFTVLVKNAGNYANQANLSLSGEAAAMGTLGRDSVFLSGGGQAYVQVTVNISRDTLAGIHNMSVRAEVREGSALHTDDVALSVTVNATHSLKFEGKVNNQAVNMAQTLKAVLAVNISNYGNLEETAVLAVRASFQNWQQWKLPTVSQRLLPFEKMRVVNLEIEVAKTAPAGFYDLTVRLSYSGGTTAEEKDVSLNLLRPDLSLSPDDIRVTPSSPGVKENLEITATVRNHGGAPVRGVNATFELNNESIGSVVITDTMTAGGSAVATILHKGLLYGDNVIKVTIDPEDRLLEVSEENNEASVRIFGYQADLSAASPVFRKPGKTGTLAASGLAEGLTDISVTISNTGRYCRDVENVEVNFTVDGKLLETRIISVKAGQQTETSTAWFAKKGTHTVQVVVDPGNRFDESVETNNQVAVMVKVTAPAEKPADYTGMLVLAAGIIALALVAGVLMYQSTRKTAPEWKERARPHLLRVKPGARKPACIECGKPVPEGGLYFKCDCGSVYHKRCNPEGVCKECAPEEEE